jgi:1,4-alpha-glucan branching enzyme
MGGEFGQRREWTHEQSLEWHVLGLDGRHEGVQKWVADLNALLRREPALHALDFAQDGFQWIRRGDWEQSALVFLRKDKADLVLVACNFTPVPRHGYRIGVPCGGRWHELLNSDAQLYGGSGVGNLGGVDAEPTPCDGHSHSISVTLPPLGAVFLKPA